MNKTLKLASLALAMTALLAGCNRADSPDGNVQVSAPPVLAETPSPQAYPPVAVTWESYDVSLAPAAGGNCALDAIDGAPPAGARVSAGSEVTFSGWTGNVAMQVPTDARLVLASDSNGYSAPLSAGGERPDVAAALQAEALATSGFNLLARMDVAPGSYGLSIAHGADDTAAACALNATLMITR